VRNEPRGFAERLPDRRLSPVMCCGRVTGWVGRGADRETGFADLNAGRFRTPEFPMP